MAPGSICPTHRDKRLVPLLEPVRETGEEQRRANSFATREPLSACAPTRARRDPAGGMRGRPEQLGRRTYGTGTRDVPPRPQPKSENSHAVPAVTDKLDRPIQ